MAIIFTICSNNYLGQATVLGHAIKKHMPGTRFFCILVDTFSNVIDYGQLPFTTIEVKDIEPEINYLVEKYNIVELNTCVKPQAFLYLFENFDDKQVIYLDPDIVIYDTLDDFTTLFRSYDILLTPHVLTPVPMDGKKPDENIFLNYGLYNLGFIAVQRSAESLEFLDWWKERTYLNGYDRIWNGIFVDQLYINLVPVFFKKVHILTGKGYNMGPWNLHERYLTLKNGTYYVDDTVSLKFYHFSSFQFDSIELPVHFYDRFSIAQREDLLKLYMDYNEQLAAAGYLSFSAVKCSYLMEYQVKEDDLLRLGQLQKWHSKPWIDRLLIKLFNRFSPSFRLKATMMLNEYPPPDHVYAQGPVS